MRIDGHAFGAWCRELTHAVIYTDAHFRFSQHFLPLMKPGDSAIGFPHAVAGLNFETRTGHTRIMLGDAWGVDRSSVESMAAGMEAQAADLAERDIRWGVTAASTAVRLCEPHILRYHCPGLPARWRAFAASGIHAGPIIHAMGGGENVVHIDRRRAYYAAMRKPIPGGVPRVCRTLDRALSRPSLIDAEWTVPYHCIPPLPLRTARGRVIYPYGTWRAVYPSSLAHVAMADYGVTVTKFYGAMEWPYTHQGFVAAMDVIDTLPKRTAKPLYTRIWGKLAREGGWTGTINPGTGIALGSGLEWSFKGLTENTARSGPFYRPDVAAWIVGDNHAETMRAARQLEDIVAIHVDSIWSSDKESKVLALASPDGPPGSWAHKDTGINRYYCSGQYHTTTDAGKHHIGYAGWQGPTAPTPPQLAAWAAVPSTRDGPVSRCWSGEPRTNIAATSTPLRIDAPEVRPFGGSDPHDDRRWLPDGSIVELDV